MVMFLKEKNAKKVFDNYPKGVTAYTYVKSRKPSMDIGVDFEYVYFKDILPTPDEISAVVSGDVKPKKYIKAMKKTITKSFGENMRDIHMAIGVCSMVNMLLDDNMKNPKVYVFIAEDEVGDNARRTKAANKFVYKWLSELFGIFDIPVVDDKTFTKEKLGEYDGKTLKKAFSKFKKKEIRSMIRELDNKKMTSSADVIYRCMNIAHRPELIYQSLNMMVGARGSRALSDIGKKKRCTIVEQIFMKIDRSAPALYDEFNVDVRKKERDKVDKILKRYKKCEKKADKDIFEYYQLFQKVFEAMYQANRDKAAKDPNYRVVNSPKIPVFKKKMKEKKFIKRMNFYKKSSNMYLTAALIAHICALRLGVEFGSSEHVKAVTEMLALVDKNVAAQFKATVKVFVEQAAKSQK